MKGKNLFLSTVLTLALIIVACSSVNVYARGAEEVDTIAGYYKIIRLYQGGEDLTKEVEEMAAYGGGVYMILYDDGTGELNLLGETTQMKWDDKNISAIDENGEAEPIPYTINDGNIILAQDKDEMEFTRMTDEEIDAYNNGDIGKSIDDITADLLNDAYDEATGELDKEFGETMGSFKSVTDDPFTSEEKTVKFDEDYLPDLSGSMHEDTGYFEIMAFSEGDTSYSLEELQNAGVDFKIMLCPDGTGFAYFIDTYYDIAGEDGTIYLASEEGQEKIVYFTSEYDGTKVITISDDNMAMIFDYVDEADPTYEWVGTSEAAE